MSATILTRYTTLLCMIILVTGCASREEPRVEGVAAWAPRFALGVPAQSLPDDNWLPDPVSTTDLNNEWPEDSSTAKTQTVSQHIRHHRAEKVDAFGFTVLDLVPEKADELGFTDDEGVLIVYVEQDGPAADAHLRPGMLITGVDGIPTPTVPEFKKAIEEPVVAGAVLLSVKSREGTQTVLLRARTADGKGTKQTTLDGTKRVGTPCA